MDAKPRPNRERYLQVLRTMTPEQRRLKARELNELGKALLRAGLKQQFPHASEAELHRKFLDRLARCHNRND
jgi:hypothetical protein